MPDSWTPDRRRAERRPVPFALHAMVAGMDAPWRVRELSLGGMVVESSRPLMAGDPLTFTLGSGPEAIGPMEGHVAHSRLLLAVRYGEAPTCVAGVAFEHVTSAHAARLTDVLTAIDAHRARTPQDAP